MAKRQHIVKKKQLIVLATLIINASEAVDVARTLATFESRSLSRSSSSFSTDKLLPLFAF